MTKLTERKVIKAQNSAAYKNKPMTQWFDEAYLDEAYRDGLYVNSAEDDEEEDAEEVVVTDNKAHRDKAVNFRSLNPDDDDDDDDDDNDDELSTWDKAKSLVKPAISAAVIWENFNKLRQTRDAANDIVAPTVSAPLVSNTPIRSLDPSITNQYLKRVGSLSTRKTADATMNTINDQMLNIKKLEAYDKLSAKQVENLFKERERYDATEKENTINAVTARNEQNKLSAGIYNKKAANNAAYKKAQQELLNRSVDEMFKGMDNKIKYNAGRDIQNTQNQLDAKLNSITNKRNFLEQNPNATGRTAMQDALAQDIIDYDDLTKKLKLPTFSKVSGGWF